MTKKRIRIEHCPTSTMLGDFFTKPLQGSLFRKFRQRIMNYGAEYETAVGQECVGTSRHKSNDMSSTTSGVRDVAQPTIGPYMPIEGNAIQHASSTHLHGPQDQRPTDRNIGQHPWAAENRDDCSLVLLDCFNQT